MFHSGYGSLIERKTEKCSKESDQGGRCPKKDTSYEERLREMEIFRFNKNEKYYSFLYIFGQMSGEANE